MSRNEIDIFGSICADSTTYASLSDVLHLKNLLSDIDRLFREGEAVIGHLIGKKHQIVARLYKNDDCSCIFRVCCDKMEIWNICYSDNIDDMAWAYIDMLSQLASNLRIRNMVLS